jgi:hypothetical protein
MENSGKEVFSGVLTGRNISELCRKNGRWHDNRHALVAELAESGAGDEVIMSIAGHVSRQMLSRYSHVRNEAKRKALAEVDRQRAADKAQREKGRATGQAKRNGAPVSTVAQMLPIQ